MTNTEVSRLFGNRDPSSVHHCRRVATDPTLNAVAVATIAGRT